MFLVTKLPKYYVIVCLFIIFVLPVLPCKWKTSYRKSCNLRDKNAKKQSYRNEMKRTFNNNIIMLLQKKINPICLWTFQVYAVDDQNLFIRNFWYDGTGPDAYFWVGNTRIPTPKGWVVPYPPVDLYSDLPKSGIYSQIKD